MVLVGGRGKHSKEGTESRVTWAQPPSQSPGSHPAVRVLTPHPRGGRSLRRAGPRREEHADTGADKFNARDAEPTDAEIAGAAPQTLQCGRLAVLHCLI